LVHAVGHEGAQKPGNGDDGELGPSVMADARSGAERSEVEQGGAREGVGKLLGRSLWCSTTPSEARGTRQRAGASSCMAATLPDARRP